MTKEYSKCIYNKFLYISLCTYIHQDEQPCEDKAPGVVQKRNHCTWESIDEEDISTEQSEEKQKVRVQKKDEHKER